RVAVAAEEWGRRMLESGVVDLVDLEEGDVFRVRQKSSPEKFSGDGGGGWLDVVVAGRLWGGVESNV
nr:hypothetical protein [Tanacetum cinerariifolium]